jgi:tRNA (adenine22-N1)-methyltransferase
MSPRTEMLRLCPRLAAIAELVPPGLAVADIGTDHALLPSALVLAGHVPHALACDRAPGPLACARLTLARHALGERVQLRLGEGLAALRAGEVATVVIAGMGPNTLIDVLAADLEHVRGLTRLVLQPNFGAEAVRRWLADHALALVDERLVEDRGRFYTVLAATPGADDRAERETRDAAAWALGPHVLRRGGPTLRRYLEDELRRCDRAAAGLGRSPAPDPAQVQALAERRALLAGALANAGALSHPGPA